MTVPVSLQDFNNGPFACVIAFVSPRTGDPSLIPKLSVGIVKHDAARREAAQRSGQPSARIGADLAVHPSARLQQRAFQPTIRLVRWFVHEHSDVASLGHTAEDFGQLIYGRP